LSGVVKEFTNDQISAFYATCCDQNICNGATITFLLDYCSELVPNLTPEEDGKSNWATCARYGDIRFFEHVQMHFPELPGDFTHPAYSMNRGVVLNALGKWYESVAYSKIGPGMELDKALFSVLIADPVPHVESKDLPATKTINVEGHWRLQKDIKISVLCRLANVDSEVLRKYWMEQSENTISTIFHNAILGGDNILPIIQPGLFSKAPCIVDRNCTRKDYEAELKEIGTNEHLTTYIQKAKADKLVGIMKNLKDPEARDPEYEQSVIIHHVYEAVYEKDFHGELPRNPHKDTYLIMESTEESWDKFDRQLPVIDPTYIDQLISKSDPSWIRRFGPQIREWSKSLTDIGEAIKDEANRVRQSVSIIQQFEGHKWVCHEAFSALRHDLFWTLRDIFEKYPKYLNPPYSVRWENLITNQEVEQFVTELQDVKDRTAAKFKADEFIISVARQKYANHPLFKEKFKEALGIVQDSIYMESSWSWSDNSSIDHVVMAISAGERQMNFRQLQAVIVGSKIYQSIPSDLQVRFKDEPGLDHYKSRELQMLWRCDLLWPLAYHPEMYLPDFLVKDKATSLAQILLHFYEQHRQDTRFGKILKGIVARSSRSWGETDWNGAKAIFQLGDDFDFSVEPEKSWKKFETVLYKLDCEKGKPFRKVKDSAPDAKLSEKDVDPRDYSNYTGLFNAMVKAAKAELKDRENEEAAMASSNCSDDDSEWED
jgi:hypothetical protein